MDDKDQPAQVPSLNGSYGYDDNDNEPLLLSPYDYSMKGISKIRQFTVAVSVIHLKKEIISHFSL